MLNLLQILRYCVFVVFLICNAVITSVAVWNLSIIESDPSLGNAKQTDGLLIFVGASGLLLILTIFFFDIYRKNFLFVRVWFELAWVAIYCIFELAGAAALTAQSTSQTCDFLSTFSDSSSPCTSTQVLQAFTWICATLLLGYFTFLSILTVVKKRDDPTILHCAVRRFPIATTESIKDVPADTSEYPRFVGGGAPVIAAPIPRRLPPTHREPILSYNSGLSYRSGIGLDYEIEHYQSPESVFYAATSEEGGNPHAALASPTTLAPVAARTSRIVEQDPDQPQLQLQQIQPSHQPSQRQQSQRQSQQQQQQPQQQLYSSSSSPFYHSSVQSAIKTNQATQPQTPAPAHVEQQIRRLPPSPPPLGDWPRLDATSRPRGAKRKPLPHPQAEPSDRHDPQPQQLDRLPSQSRSRAQPLPQPPQPQPQLQLQPQREPLPQPQPQPQPQLQPQPSRHSRPLPPAKRTPSSYKLDATALTAALKPLQASQSMRSKPSRPSGPRGKSDSIDDGGPADMEMGVSSGGRTHR